MASDTTGLYGVPHIREFSRPDPADVMLISGYVLNLWRGRMQVDAVFCVDGRTFADVSQRNPSLGDPPDTTTYEWCRRERRVDGEDVECLELRNGMLEHTGDCL